MRGKLLPVLLPLVLIGGIAAAQPNIWHLVNGVVHGPAIVVTSTQVGDGSASAPSYSFASQPGLGMYRIATDRLGFAYASGSVAGQFDGTVTQFRLNDSWSLAWSDIALSRGAANRVDLATGDSFHLVSGGLGVGVTPPSAGSIEASGSIQAGANLVAAAAGLINWAGRSVMRSTADGKLSLTTNDGTTATLSEQFTDAPTCGTNCGTSPTITGVDSSFALVMGATGSPASGFVITFNGTWAAAPQCTGAMALAGMVVGKLPLTLVTTTTTLTVVTNGTAPANSDRYHFRCSLGQ